MTRVRLLRIAHIVIMSDMPRVRIVIPLSREVSGDEHRALSSSVFVVSLARCLSLMNVLINLINLCFCRLVLWVLLVGLCRGQGGAVDVEKYLSLGELSLPVMSLAY